MTSRKHKNLKSAATSAPAAPTVSPTEETPDDRRLFLILLLILPVIAWLPFLPIMPKLATEYLGHSATDMSLQYRHFIAFATDMVRQGVPPVWNPYVFCGTPFFGSAAATIYYPPNWVFLLGLPQPLSVNLVILLHVAMAGVFAMFWARVRECSAWACLLAGLSVALGSLITPRIFAGHFAIVCSAAWLPALFAALEAVLRRGWTYVPALSIAGCMVVLGGGLQIAYYAALTAGLFAVMWLIGSGRHKDLPWLRQRATMLVVAFALAGLCCAIEVVQVLTALRDSARTGAKGADWLAFFSMPIESLWSLLIPNYFGEQLAYFGRFFWWETTVYFGGTSLVLIIAGMMQQSSRRLMWVPVAMGCFCLVLACAGLLPGLRSLVGYLPGWSVFRGHAKIAMVAVVMFSIAAAHGLDGLRTAMQSRAGWKPVLPALVIGIILVVSMLVLAFVAGPEHWTLFLQQGFMPGLVDLANPSVVNQLSASAFTASVGAVVMLVLFLVLCAMLPKIPMRFRAPLVCGVAALEVVVFSWGHSTSSFRAEEQNAPTEAQNLAAVVRTVGPSWGRVEFFGFNLSNAGMRYGLPTLTGHDINVTRFFDTYVCALLGLEKSAPNLAFALRDESPLLDLASVAYIFLRAPLSRIQKEQTKWQTMAEQLSLALYKRPSSLPRAFIVGRARGVPDDENEIIKALATWRNWRREVLLVNAPTTIPEDFDALAVPMDAGKSPLEYTVTAVRPGWLVVTDGFSTQWRASVGGEERPIYRANGAFRAVRVSGGESVRFAFDLKPFWFGATCSVGGFVAVFIWAIVMVRRRQRNRAAQIVGV